MTTAAEFFTDQTTQSRTKTRIVFKYFQAWAKLLGGRARRRGEVIQYLDPFAGPGRYADGSPSTPLLVLQHAVASPALHDLLVTRFNDADPETADSLERAIRDLPGVGVLKHPPVVSCSVIDERVADLFESRCLPATFTFLDPFGYAGLSARLVRAALKDDGCECAFFFNFNRVNPAIDNDCVEEHVRRLFDAADAQTIRTEVAGLPPAQREQAVVRRLVEGIKRKHARHVLHFRFLTDDACRTSHYLVFATKNQTGAKIMKDIMAKESSWAEDGTPAFACSPKVKPRTKTLFDPLDPVDDLADQLTEAFAGQTITVAGVYLDHGLERRETPSQYKDALRRLEAAGQVTAAPPAAERRDGTLADHVVLRFPRTEG